MLPEGLTRKLLAAFCAKASRTIMGPDDTIV